MSYTKNAIMLQESEGGGCKGTPCRDFLRLRRRVSLFLFWETDEKISLSFSTLRTAVDNWIHERRWKGEGEAGVNRVKKRPRQIRSELRPPQSFEVENRQSRF